MENCFYIHPDNINQAKKIINTDIAVIARPDDFLEKNEYKHLIVESETGIHTRCYLASYHNISFIIVYGRFDRIRTTSYDIDYMLTQKTLNFLGIKKIIGTFVVGSIKKNIEVGSVFIPDNFVGLGGYNQSIHLKSGFRNADMLKPFCHSLRTSMIENKNHFDFEIHQTGTYACFHQFPRIETEAELDYFEQLNWDIVGQTLDPEATLARESGCHYAALAVTIDDRKVRQQVVLEGNLEARSLIDDHIISGRIKTFNVFLQSLVSINQLYINCSCNVQKDILKQKKRYHFYYRPKHLIMDQEK